MVRVRERVCGLPNTRIAPGWDGMHPVVSNAPGWGSTHPAVGSVRLGVVCGALGAEGRGAVPSAPGWRVRARAAWYELVDASLLLQHDLAGPGIRETQP